jgi:hypothetical protein
MRTRKPGADGGKTMSPERPEAPPARRPAATPPPPDKPAKAAREERVGEEPAARTAPDDSASAISPEERRKRIAERAYYKALARGFGGGEVERDWLDAERETDEELLRKPGSRT